ncbi:HIT domain-containing protein [uncultured Cohaesibacter sp.]|uniref:HIT family protein n=1 Tax=uncultured Cohaesibacter sp. TaxID=1002546 RepID=UPI0029C8B093|nr:HIT domain-containing protein [uncultured Cohaesibacter sp.]
MTDGTFTLHERLIKATRPLISTALSDILMMEERRIPWLLLVPRREGVEEFHHLSVADRQIFIEEIAAITAGLEKEFSPVRINVGDLGNIVGQMHVHLVARQTDDPFWPQVVWSRDREPFRNDEEADMMRQRLMRACSSLLPPG